MVVASGPIGFIFHCSVQNVFKPFIDAPSHIADRHKNEIVRRSLNDCRAIVMSSIPTMDFKPFGQLFFNGVFVFGVK